MENRSFIRNYNLSGGNQTFSYDERNVNNGRRFDYDNDLKVGIDDIFIEAMEFRNKDVVYEIWPRYFAKAGAAGSVFDEILLHADRLKAMGVSMLWHTPIHSISYDRTGADVGSPYAVLDYNDINPEYTNDSTVVNMPNPPPSFPNISPSFPQHFPNPPPSFPNISQTFPKHFPNISQTFPQPSPFIPFLPFLPLLSSISPSFLYFPFFPLFPLYFSIISQPFPYYFPFLPKHFPIISPSFRNHFPIISQRFPFFPLFPLYSHLFPNISQTFTKHFPNIYHASQDSSSKPKHSPYILQSSPVFPKQFPSFPRFLL